MEPRASTPVFRGYDRAALDREYNNREKVPNAAAWLARYEREAERARGELPAKLDIPYGPHPAETLDVFPAPTGAPAPVHVFIHGGYWHRLDKRDFSWVARAFGPAGVATVVINYALVPAVDMEELVRQCRAAVAWTWKHAATFGGDPDRVFVSGHSAGGHLVAMLLATEWAKFDAPGDVVKGATGISGLYDLEPIRLSYLNDVLALTAETARRYSPIVLRPRARPPLLLAVGGREGAEYHRQTEELAAAWRAHGVPIEVLDQAGHDHFSIVAQLEDPASPLSRAMLHQMGRA
jgi:arylformamidase